MGQSSQLPLLSSNTPSSTPWPGYNAPIAPIDPQNILDKIFKNNTYANNNGVQTAGSVPVLGGDPGIFNNGVYAFNGTQAAQLGAQMQAALAARQRKPVFDNQIIAINTAAPVQTGNTTGNTTGSNTTVTPETVQPVVQTTPFVGTQGMFNGQYYGTTANPMTWMIQPSGKYVEAHGVLNGQEKTLAEIAALGGLSKAYVGADLVDLGTAYQAYEAPKQAQQQQQQVTSTPQLGGSPVTPAGAPGGGFVVGNPATYGDAFSQQLYDFDPNRAAMQNELQSILNDRLYNPSAYGSGYATLGNTGQSQSNMNLYGSIIGAANSAGNLINTAFGGTPSFGNTGASAAFASSLTTPSRGSTYDVATSNYTGTPYYQLNGGGSTLPANVQSELAKQQAYMQALSTNNVAGYMAQYGAPPNTLVLTSYVSQPPAELQQALLDWTRQATQAQAQARLSLNPNDPLANAFISNHHITNQFLNTPGAASGILLPEGNQKGRLLRSIPGVNADPALLAWADQADRLTDQLYPAGMGQYAGFAYNSEGMSASSAAPNGYVYTGSGSAANEWIPGLHAADNPVYWGQPNSGLPAYMQPNPSPFQNNPGGQVQATPGYTTSTSAQILPKGYYEPNGGTPAEPSRSGLPSGEGVSRAQPANMIDLPTNITALDVNGNPVTRADAGDFYGWVNQARAMGLDPTKLIFIPMAQAQPVTGRGSSVYY